MAKELKKMIREAFNTAYNIHKGKLHESAASLAAKLSPQEKAHADALIDILVNKKPGYQEVKWDPSGISQGIGQYIPVQGKKKEITQKEQNYLVEFIFESYRQTKDEKYRTALASFFAFTGIRHTVKNMVTGADEIITDESPIFKLAWQRYMGGKGKNAMEANKALERLEKKNPGALYNFIANSWQKMFTPEFFNQLVDTYVDKSEEIEGANFGRFLTTRIITDLANQIRDTTGANTEFGHNLKSIDAPSNVTGKSTDIGDETGEDLGGEDDELPTGVGATDDDYNEDETNLYQKDRPEGEHEKLADDEMEKSQKTAREMTNILISSIQEAINDFREYLEIEQNSNLHSQEIDKNLAIKKLNTGNNFKQKDAALKALSAAENKTTSYIVANEALNILEKILNTGETDTIESGKVNSALKKGSIGRMFIRTVDRYLFENGFTNPEGKVMTFNDIGLGTLAKLVKLKNSGYQNVGNLKESKLWFIEELVLEVFVNSNLDKIMERVYKRLSPKLNS